MEILRSQKVAWWMSREDILMNSRFQAQKEGSFRNSLQFCHATGAINYIFELCKQGYVKVLKPPTKGITIEAA